MKFALSIGSHVPRKAPLETATSMGFEVIQLNLSAPRNWDPPREHGDEKDLKSSSLPIFVHSPYLINPSSVKKESRLRSRACLERECEAAARIGASGVVVHGGHPTGDGSVDEAVAGWVDTLSEANLSCRILIENTAGGSNSPAKTAEGLSELVLTLRAEGHDIGVTFDTCHAWAASQDPAEMAAQLIAELEKIDFVHANNSRDSFGSGRDRHANLTAGEMHPDRILEAVSISGAPTVVETPGGISAQANDVNWLRANLR